MNNRKGKKLGLWVNYLVGFTGCGPTALDVKPRRALGRKEKTILARMQKQMEEEKGRRHNAYRHACIEVLGEDPDSGSNCSTSFLPNMEDWA